MSATSVYNAPARMLHWSLVALIAAEFGLAWLMPDVRRDTQPIGLIAWHIGVGTTILGLMLLRLLWRWGGGTPEPHPVVAPWQDRAARATHALLYAGFLVLPVLGWINASSRGWTVHLAGLLSLPALAAQGAGWAHEMGDVHQLVAYGLLGLIGLHVAAAGYHQFVLRDGLMRRMWPKR